MEKKREKLRFNRVDRDSMTTKDELNLNAALGEKYTPYQKQIGKRVEPSTRMS